MALDNSLSTYTNRRKYRLASLDTALRNMTVAEAIVVVDRGDGKYIDSPYGDQSTATVSSITGTYSVGVFGTHDDLLTITDQFVKSDHIYANDRAFSNFDLMANRLDESNYAITVALDQWALCNLLTDGTGTYSTPSGGFTTAANIITIMANLNSKYAGYSEAQKGTFLVIENTDLVGFEIAQATNGYNTADSVLNNGFYRHFMGTDIYVVRSGTFVTSTLGTKSVVASGHRVAGVKGLATLAIRDMGYVEKEVSGKTGFEQETHCFAGFCLWTPRASLIIDITIV